MSRPSRSEAGCVYRPDSTTDQAHTLQQSFKKWDRLCGPNSLHYRPHSGPHPVAMSHSWRKESDHVARPNSTSDQTLRRPRKPEDDSLSWVLAKLKYQYITLKCPSHPLPPPPPPPSPRTRSTSHFLPQVPLLPKKESSPRAKIPPTSGTQWIKGW